MNSVVMATYKGEKYIVEQLDSIKNQSLPPDEVIICDDCSTDNTAGVIKRYIEENLLGGWHLTINEKKLGYYDNFFKAISKAKGDIIYLSDQDDVWDLDKIETFESYYDRDKDLVMIQSNICMIDANGTLLKSREKYHGIKDDGAVYLDTSSMCRFAGSGFTMSFRKEIVDIIFENNLEKNSELFEYHDLLLGLVSSAKGKCMLISNVIDFHRLHIDNATQKQNKVFYSDRRKSNQLDILHKRKHKFAIMSSLTSDSKKKEIYNSFAEFSGARESYISLFSFRGLKDLIKRKSQYASKFGIVTDTLYSIGLEKLLLLLYRKF